MSEELPENWVWTTLDQVALIQGGIQKQQKRRPVNNRYPFLRVANVGRGTLDLEDVHEIELFEGELDRFALQVGDLLVVEGNGSPDQLGRAAMWCGEIPNCVHQNHLIRVRPLPIIEPTFLAHVWNSPVVTDQLKLVASSTSGLHTLSTSKLKGIRLPLAPWAEQRRIVDIVDDHLSRIDSAVRSLSAAITRGRHLRSSILNAAFVGRLVPQDLADRPASELLAMAEDHRAAARSQMRPPRGRSSTRFEAASQTLQEELPL